MGALARTVESLLQLLLLETLPYLVSRGTSDQIPRLLAAKIGHFRHLAGASSTIAADSVVLRRLACFLTSGEHLLQRFSLEGAIFVQTCHISALVQLGDAAGELLLTYGASRYGLLLLAGLD